MSFLAFRTSVMSYRTDDFPTRSTTTGTTLLVMLLRSVLAVMSSPRATSSRTSTPLFWHQWMANSSPHLTPPQTLRVVHTWVATVLLMDLVALEHLTRLILLSWSILKARTLLALPHTPLYRAPYSLMRDRVLFKWDDVLLISGSNQRLLSTKCVIDSSW